MPEIGVTRELEELVGDTHLWGVLVGRRGHRLGGHHRQRRCRGDMVHPGWESHREPAGMRNAIGLRGKKSHGKWGKKEGRKGEVMFLTRAPPPTPGRQPRWFDNPHQYWMMEVRAFGCIGGEAKRVAGDIFPGEQPGTGRADDACHGWTAYLHLRWADQPHWLLHWVDQLSWLLCWVDQPHGDWMHGNEEGRFNPLLEANRGANPETAQPVWISLNPGGRLRHATLHLLKLLCFL